MKMLAERECEGLTVGGADAVGAGADHQSRTPAGFGQQENIGERLELGRPGIPFNAELYAPIKFIRERGANGRARNLIRQQSDA